MQAKILSEREIQKALDHADAQSRAMLLLSTRAGLRACEIAALDWRMVTTASGDLADAIDLPAIATKGRTGAGRLPMAPDLRAALLALGVERRGPVLRRGAARLSPAAVAKRIKRTYERADLDASSHSGRRSILTKASAKGLNAFQVQAIARHADISTTRRYVDAASDPSIAAFLTA